MENELLLLLGSLAVAVTTEACKWLQKKYTPWITPSLLAGIVALVFGLLYAIIWKLGLYEVAKEFTLATFAGATIFYRLWKYTSKKLS
jgi:uncharacterized protein YacL